MKKATILIVLISMFYTSKAQITVSDSTEMGAGYANDVFYSFATGEVKTVDGANWQIAFSVMPTNFPTNTLQGTTIRVNGGRNYILKRVPSVKIADFASFTDTTGLASWSENMDSDSAWDVGAFNKGWFINVNTANYGWGKYNPITKAVETDSSVWVVYKEDGSWIKKLYISKQDYDTLYTFTYANMDNSNTMVDAEVNKRDYSKRNFVYYDLDNDVIRDREPDNDSWDILFTKYRTGIPFGPGPLVPYALTGVLHNVGVKTEQVDNVKVGDANYTAANLDTRISTIGWDWKAYNPPAMKYDIKDSSTYFVKTNGNSVYSLVFTGFNGSADGKSYFDITQVINSVKSVNAVETFTVYPNPSTDIVNVNIAATADINGVISIMDVTGKVVYQENMNVAQGQLVTKTIDVSTLNSGMYFVTITSNNGTSSQKLIVK